MWTLAYRTAILLYATITTCLSHVSVKMDGGKTAAGELSLVCYNPSFSLPLTSVYWRRNNTNIVKTKLLWWSEHFKPKDLKHNIKVWTSWRKHRILVTRDLDSNIASNWSCSTDKNEGFTEPKTFGKDRTTDATIYDPVSTADPGVQRKRGEHNDDPDLMYIVVGSTVGAIFLLAVIVVVVCVRKRVCSKSTTVSPGTNIYSSMDRNQSTDNTYASLNPRSSQQLYLNTAAASEVNDDHVYDDCMLSSVRLR